MNNTKLREYDAQITEYLSQLFDYTPHQHKIWDMRDPESSEMRKHLGPSMNNISFWQNVVTGAFHLIAENDGDIEYNVMVSADREEDYPLLLAEGIAGAEHLAFQIEYMIENRHLDSYYETFEAPFISMLSHLGGRAAYKHVKGIDSDMGHAFCADNEMAMLSSIGHIAGCRLYHKGKDIPYRDIFHAPIQEEGWGLVHNTTLITIPVLLDSIPPELRPTLDYALEGMLMFGGETEIKHIELGRKEVDPRFFEELDNPPEN